MPHEEITEKILSQLARNEATHLESAMNAFSRPADIDAPVYRKFLEAGQYRTVIELGAGTGRLVEIWLSMGLRVIAVEVNPTLRSSLVRRFSAFIASGQLSVVETVEASPPPLAPTVLIAPFNVAFYFESPSAFSAHIACAFAIGAESVIFDVDNISDANWNSAFRENRIYRRVALFIEEVEVVGRRRLNVQWRHQTQLTPFFSFPLFLHPKKELSSAIKARLPNSRLLEFSRRRDSHGANIVFFKVHNPNSQQES